MPAPVSRLDISQSQLDLLQATVDVAMAASADALYEMSGQPIEVLSSAIEIVPLASVPTSVGSPEDPAIGVYVGMEGDGEGYLLLLLDNEMALKLAGMMLGEEVEAIEDELTASALAEAGNVSCSSFLNAVSEASGLRVQATPPVVVGDMRGAIMDIAVANVATAGDDALVIKTQLSPVSDGGETQVVNARVVAIPTPETFSAILDGLLHRAPRES